MVRHGDQLPSWPWVRTATVIALWGRVTPCAQVTPTSPKPVTGWGVVVRRLAPVGEAPTRAADVVRTARPAGATAAVSCTSRTSGLTGAVGTRDGRTAWAMYAAVWADGRARAVAPAGPPGAEPTTSRVTMLAAGVSTASTTARASSCWQAVTKREREGVIPATPVRGKSHTGSKFHIGNRRGDTVSE